tara:strand:+ start:578 stop:1552 length:975 start_codon:yes stop_codon:yes gene_type:complete
MGWLRKKGRQLKKGIGKLFSTKLGRIVGTIGLSMAMGWAARSLMQGAQSLFATAPPVEPGISEVVAEEVAEEAVEEVTTETLQRAASNLQETITSSKDVLNSIDKASSNQEAFNLFQGELDKKVLDGSVELSSSSTITESVEKVSADLTQSYSPEELLASGDDLFASKDSLVLKPGATLKQGMENPYKYAELPEGATIGEKFRRFVGNPLESTKNFFVENVMPESISEATGDVVKGQIAGYIEDKYFTEEPPYQGKLPAGLIPTEAAQQMYVQDMSSQWMASNNATRVPNFKELTNSYSFGIGTPQYLQEYNQGMVGTTIPMPT